MDNDRNTIQYVVVVGIFVPGTEKIQQILFRNKYELNTSHGLVLGLIFDLVGVDAQKLMQFGQDFE